MNSAYRRFGKRALDAIVSLVVMGLLFPLIAVIAAIVRATLGRPVLFRQQRPGLHGRLFTIVKFRTMTDQRDADGHLLPDIQRLTGLGKFLRRTSLDELPEFWNVLRGDMGLVGPRPLLTQYLNRYTPAQASRHDVRPGITGWAQVNGRNSISWEDRFALDLWYVDHLSLWLDTRILVLTAWRVARCQGVAEAGQATMREFMGGKT